MHFPLSFCLEPDVFSSLSENVKQIIAGRVFDAQHPFRVTVDRSRPRQSQAAAGTQIPLSSQLPRDTVASKGLLLPLAMHRFEYYANDPNHIRSSSCATTCTTKCFALKCQHLSLTA